VGTLLVLFGERRLLEREGLRAMGWGGEGDIYSPQNIYYSYVYNVRNIDIFFYIRYISKVVRQTIIERATLFIVNHQVTTRQTQHTHEHRQEAFLIIFLFNINFYRLSNTLLQVAIALNARS
jgi:hypothetical protein